ncbi:unnamed protein product [Heterobilharzia americana]|nr:unnamed protein product [Heterobilharzia americana]
MTSNISKFFLMNSTTGVSLQPQSTEDQAKTKGDEHNYHSAVVPWHLQIQFSSDQGLARENASYSDYNPRSHQTDNTNVTQGGFCTHANTPSTYFDFSSLHSERKDGSLDGSVSGKAVLATEKNPSRSWTRKTSKSSRCTPRMKPKIAWDASSSTRNKPLGEDAVSVMESWYESHTDNPYPTASEKEQIAALGGITVMQVCSWFANRRTRTANTKPKKNRRKLHSKIHDLCIEIERATNKVINAENLEERIGQIIDEYLI